MKTVLASLLIALSGSADARIARDAADVKLGPELIASTPGAVANVPKLAQANGRSLVVWSDPTTSSIEASLDGIAIEIFDKNNHAYLGYTMYPVVAAGPDEFLVAWFDYSRILATRIRIADGTVLDRQPLVVASDAELNREIATEIDVAFDGSGFLIAWSGPSLNLARVTPEGTITRLGGMAPSDGSQLRHLETLIWTGSELLLPHSIETILPADPLVKGRAYLTVKRVSADGTEIATPNSPTFTEIGYGYVKASAERKGDRLTHVWSGSYERSVWIAQTTLDGEVISPPHRIYGPTEAPGYVRPPAVTWNGSEFLIGWVEGDAVNGTYTDWKVRGMRVGADTEPIDAEPFDIADDAAGTETPALIAVPAGVTLAYARTIGDVLATGRAYTRFLAATKPRGPHRRSAGH